MGPETNMKTRATLTVGGRDVPMNHFVELTLVNVIEGFLKALRDVPVGEVVIRIPAERRHRQAEGCGGY